MRLMLLMKKEARLVEAKEDVDEHLIRKEEKAKLRLDMDQGVASRKHRLANAVHKQDAEQLLDLITASVEEGYVNHMGLNLKQAVRMNGRGC